MAIRSLDKLRLAATNIREAATELNTEMTTCACCGTNRYDNYEDYKQAEHLRGVLARLDKIVSSQSEPKDENDA